MFEVFSLTLGKVGMMLIFIGIGYFLRRHRDLPDDAGHVLSLLCTLLFSPAYSIATMSKSFTREVLGENALLIGYGVLFVLVAIGLSFCCPSLLQKTGLNATLSSMPSPFPITGILATLSLKVFSGRLCLRM